MLCINNGMLAENMEKSLFTQPWLTGKSLHKLGFFPGRKYAGSPRSRGSQQGFSVTGTQAGVWLQSFRTKTGSLKRRHSKNLPCSQRGSGSAARPAVSGSSTALAAGTRRRIRALAAGRQRSVLRVCPNCFGCSFTYWREWAFVLDAKERKQ